MRLTPGELGHVRSFGLYITEKCDKCGKLLNQTFRYTIAEESEVYCSALCRDSVFLGNEEGARRRTKPGACAYCGGSLSAKRRGALYCSDRCRQRDTKEPGSLKNGEGRNIAVSDPIESTHCSRKNRGLGQWAVPAYSGAESALEALPVGGTNGN